MALTATIFKAALQLADMDRNYYQDHALTLARHPCPRLPRASTAKMRAAANWEGWILGVA